MAFRNEITYLTEIESVGTYIIENSSEMPTTSMYRIISFGTKGKEWIIHLLAFDEYSNIIYKGRLVSSDGNIYSFTTWNQIQIA